MAKSPFLLVTDLDGTLIDTALATTEDNQLVNNECCVDEKLERFKTAWQSACPGSRLVYNTGNSLGSLRLLAQKYQLPCPDVAILQTGALVCSFPDGDIQGKELVDTEWTEAIQEGFDKQTVLDVLAPFMSSLTPNAGAALDDAPLKVAVIAKSTPVKDEVVEALERELPKRGVNAKILVHSADWCGGDTPFIDILPSKAGKGHVTAYIRNKLGFAEERTMVAGDSGNDFLMFQVGNERGTIVGSANKEMLEFHEAEPHEHHYLAKARCADGIVEGLEHFEFL